MAKRSNSKIAPAKAARDLKIQTGAFTSKPWAFTWLFALKVLAIIAAGLFIYSPVFHGGWLMDDNAYVTQNPSLRSVDGLINFWLKPGSFVEYYPIEETLLWIMWQFNGDNASGYHILNIILHIIGALLVWKFLSKLGLRFAWLGGLIFAAHPANVESVAWVAELKNTLSLPPFLIAMCFWIDYEERKKDGDYFLALGFFFIAMLCKITMAPFPIIILLYAWWKRGRVGWDDLRGTIPFFAISLVLGMMTIFVGEWYAPGHVLAIKVPMGDFWSRLACAGLSISFYFCHFFMPLQIPYANANWPVDSIPLQMLPAYPQWKVDPPTLLQFLPWPIMLGVFCWAWARRKTWGKTVLLGLGFFLLGLAPFVGFHEVSYMRFTWVMDHFLYLPMLGLLALSIAGLEQIDNVLSKMGHRILVGALVVLIGILTIESHYYARTFVNLETSWTYEIKYNPSAWLAHNNLGYIMVEQNRLDEARDQFIEALQIKPDYSEAHNNLGVVYSRTGHIEEAIREYRAALTVNPDYGDAQNNLDKLLYLQKTMQQRLPPVLQPQAPTAPQPTPKK